jgi:hypothetical protein
MCRRNPPIDLDGSVPQTAATDWCGEWADKTITPEQEDLRQLTRQFAVAIMSTEWGKNLSHIGLWGAAEKLAVAEPQIQKEGQQ